MSIEAAEKDTLVSLQPDAVQAYLRTRGWEDVGTEGPSARVYMKPEVGAKSEVLVPTKPSAPDYGVLTGMLVERVSRVERMTRGAVLHDLSLAGYDVLRIRITDADDGNLDLEKAVVVIKEARAALVAAAAATAAGAPRKNYAGRQHESVGAFVDQVRVGQTERGSFVVPLLSSYAFDVADNASLPGEWFARRVMKKLTSGLSAIDDVLGSSDGDVENFTNATAKGVSANLCGALGRLVQHVGNVEIGVRWASAAPEPVTRSVTLAEASSATLIRAAAKLAEADPPPSEPLIGFITQLDDAVAGPLATATLQTWIDSKLKNVVCYFDDTYRARFTDAWHSRRPIVIDGQLKLDGKRLAIREINDATLIDPQQET